MKLSDLMQNIPVISYQNISLEAEITSITSKSQSVQKGSAFVCLKGTHVNGADFAQEALKNGAHVLVCETPLSLDCAQIIVPDTHFALAQLCDNFYQNPTKSMNVIGVTGTNGKTSCVHFLQHIFRTAGKKTALCSTIGDNTDTAFLGISGMTTADPEDLYPRLRKIADVGTEYLFLEVSSHALAQKKVAPIHFCCAMITNLSQDHLDYHKTMEEYARAKGTILSQSDVTILPHNSAYTALWKSMSDCPTFTYAIEEDSADFTAKNCRLRTGGISFEFLSKQTIFRIASPLIGHFTYDNALLCCAASLLCGIDVKTLTRAFSDMPQVRGRMERLSLPAEIDFSVYLDYAHTPDALKRALLSLREQSKGNLWVIFGCGGNRDQSKRAPMGEIASQYADCVIVTEDNSRNEMAEEIFGGILQSVPKKKDPILIQSRADAIFYAITHAQPHDILLFAGKGHEDYEIQKDGKHPFSERNLIENACKIRIAQKKLQRMIYK